MATSPLNCILFYCLIYCSLRFSSVKNTKVVRARLTSMGSSALPPASPVFGRRRFFFRLPFSGVFSGRFCLSRPRVSLCATVSAVCLLSSSPFSSVGFSSVVPGVTGTAGVIGLAAGFPPPFPPVPPPPPPPMLSGLYLYSYSATSVMSS